jgi:O-antigen/teichoic acid export membrane protein
VNIVALKLVETFVRSLFVLVTSYALQIEQSGRFGLVVTLIGLFAFLFGYERQVDLQRKMVGQPSLLFDRRLVDALWFWSFNYSFEVPLFALLMFLWIKLPPALVLWSVVIVIGEHLANQAYQMAMIGPRYRHLMLVVTAKNVSLLAAVAYLIAFDKPDLSLDNILLAWGVLSVGSIVVLAAGFLFIRERVPREEQLSLEIIWRQYRASLAHFLIGSVAILSVQMDRLVAGALLVPAEVGSYFRHVMLISIVYQLFNIASFNRVLPNIFSLAQTQTVTAIRPVVRREYLLVIAVSVVIYLTILVVGYLPRIDFFARYHIRPELLAVFFTSFLLRAGADLNGILLNGKGLERRILRIQATALAIGLLFYVVLASRFGIAGAAVAGLAAPSIYLGLSRRTLSAYQASEAA